MKLAIRSTHFYRAGVRGIGALALLLCASACQLWTETGVGEVENPGAEISLKDSTIVTTSETVASGTDLTVTLNLKDKNGNAFLPARLIPKKPAPKVVVAIPDDEIALTSSSTGTWSDAVDNSDGTFTATFHGLKAGTAITVKALVNDKALESDAPKVRVIPGKPHQITVLSGDAQTGIAGTVLPDPLAVLVKDAFGNVVPGANIDFTLTAGGGQLSTPTHVQATSDGSVSTLLTLGLAAGANTVRATVVDADIPLVVNFSNTAVPGVPASLTVVSGNNQHGSVGQNLAAALTVVVRDNLNNIVPGTQLDWTVAPTGTAAHASLATASTTNSANGQSSNTLLLGTTPETATVTVTVHGSSPAISTTFTAVGDPGAAASLTITTGPANQNADTLLGAMTVKAYDSFGNVATSFTGNVTLALVNNPSSAAFTGTATVAASAGVASFSGVYLRKVGTGYTLHATAAGLSDSANSSSFNITAGAATTIAVSSGNSQSGTVAHALSSPFVVVVKDAYSNVISGVTVDWALTAGHGTLSSASNASDSSGLSASTLTLGNTAESETVNAKIHGSSPAVSTNFTATANPDAAAKLTITTGPTSKNADTAQDAIVIKAYDTYDNLVPTFTANVALALVNNPTSASLSGTTTVAAVAGVATFSAVNLRKVGTGYTLHATSAGLTDSPDSSAFNVTAGTSSTVQISSGNTQSGTAGQTLAAPFVVLVQDAYSNPVNGATIDWAITTGHGSLSSASSSTNSSGLANSTLTLGTLAEAEAVSATLHGSSPTVSVSFSATANPGSPANLVLVAVPSANAVAGAVWSGFKVKAVDSNGNTATSYTGNVTVALVSNTASATLAGTVTKAAVAGVASYTDLSISKVGTAFTVKASGTAGIADASTSAGFDIINAPASQLVFGTAPSSPTVAGVAFATMPSVTIKDTYNNVITTGPDATANITLSLSQGTGTLSGTVTLAAIAGVADFSRVATNLSINLAGNNKQLTATKADTTSSSGTAAVTKTTSSFTINNAGATTLVFLTQPQSGPAGSNPAPVVELRDTFGNPVTVGGDNSRTVTLSLASGTGALSGTLTRNITAGDANFGLGSLGTTTGGSKTLTASLTLGSSTVLTVTSSAFTVAEIPHALVLSGPSSANAGDCSTAFTVTLKDTNNQTINATGATTVALGGRAGGTFYTNSNCTTATTSTTIASGASTANFYFKDNTAESLLLTASSSGLSSATLPYTISPGNMPIKISWSGTASITSGTCSAFTVTALNNSNAASNVAANSYVSLSQSGAGTIYSDSSCSNSISSAAIAGGTSAITVYFKDSSVESLNLTGTHTALGSATYAVNVTSSSNRLVLTGPSTVAASACSTAITAQIKDSSNNAVNASGAKTLNLSTQGLGDIYSDSACATKATTATISNGTSSTTFYYRGGALGESLKVTAAESSGSILSGSLALTTSPAVYSTSIGALAENVTNPRMSCAIVSGGGVACWGKDMPLGAFPQGIAISNVTQLAVGGSTACALDSGGTVKCWGRNDAGQFGTGSGNASSTFVTVPVVSGMTGVTSIAMADGILCGVTSGGSVKCVGRNNGVIDVNNYYSTTYAVTALSGYSNVSKVVLGYYYLCALLTDHTVKCSAYNQYYIVNAGYYSPASPTAVPNLSSATDIAGGPNWVCAINAGDVYCWGQAGQAGFGDGTSGSTSTPTPRKVSGLINNGVSQLGMGYGYACALESAAGDIRCWGDNTYGALLDSTRGYNQSATTSIATQITSGAANLGTGYMASCYTDTSGIIRCAGDSYNGNKGDFQMPSSNNVVKSRAISAMARYRSGVLLTAKSASTSVITSTACVALTAAETNLSVGVPFSNAMTLTLADGGAGGGFYSDPTCATSIITVTVAAGDAAKSLYYKISTTNTPLTLSAATSASGYDSYSRSFTSSGAMASVQLASSDSAIFENVCTAKTFKAMDSNNIELTMGSDTSVGFVVSDISVFSDSSCTQPTTTMQFGAGTSRTQLYFKGANDSGYIQIQQQGVASNSFQIYPTSFVFDPSQNYTIDVGSCALRQLIGLTGGAFSSPTVVNVASDIGAVYADGQCNTPVSSVAVPSGYGSVNVYVKSSTGGPGTLTTTTAGTSRTQAITYNTAGLYQLVLSGAASINTSACQAYNLNLQNAGAGTTATYGSNLSIELHGANFYSNSGCSSSISSVTLSSGQSQLTVYIKQDTAQSLILRTLNMVMEVSDASLPVSVNAPSSAPTQLTWTGSSTINSSTCTSYTVGTLNSGGTSANVSANTTVSLSGALDGAFYSNSGCTSGISSTTISSGTNAATVYFKDAVAENTRLSAAANSLASASIAVTVSGAGVTHLALSGPTSFSAPACSSVYTVNVLDSSNAASNVSGAKTINLLGGGGGVFYSDSSCTSAITSKTIANGTSSTTFYYQPSGLNEATTLRVSESSATLAGASLNISSTASTPSKVTVGSSEACAVDGNGYVFCWGSDYYVNQSYTYHELPRLISGLSNVSKVSVGASLACALLNDQTVKCWGGGSLGNGTTNPSAIPVAVTGLTGVSDIVVGGSSACALQSSGTIKCWGSNSVGQVGTGSPATSFYASPTRINSTAAFVSLTSGIAERYCAADSNHNSWCWGHGTYSSSYNSFGSWGGDNQYSPVLMSDMPNVQNMWGTEYVTCMLDTDAVGRCVGSDWSGIFGSGGSNYYISVPMVIDNVAGMSKIASTQNVGCGIDSSGHVQCWGNSGYGTTLTGSLSAYQPTPVRASIPDLVDLSGSKANDNFCGIDSLGKIYCWGSYGSFISVNNSWSTLSNTFTYTQREFSATALEVTTASVAADTCGQVTFGEYLYGATSIGFKSAYNVSLSWATGAGTFYADSTCSRAISQVTVAPGATNQSVYVRVSSTGNYLIKLAASGVASGYTSGLSSLPPTQIGLVSGPGQYPASNACVEYVYQLYDSSWNPAAFSSNNVIPIYYWYPDQTGIFSDSSCSQAIDPNAGFPVKANVSTFKFYLLVPTMSYGGSYGEITLNLDPSNPYSADISWEEDGPNWYAYMDNTSFSAGNCEGFTIYNNYGWTSDNVVFDISADDPSQAQVYSDGSCTTPISQILVPAQSDTSYQTYYIKGNNSGGGTQLYFNAENRTWASFNTWVNFN